MVKPMLTDDMIAVGAELVRRLDETNLELRAAFWWYSVDDGAWRLLLAFPKVKQLGPRIFYRKVDSVLQRIVGAREIVPLWDTKVIDASDPVVRAVKSVRKVSGARRPRVSGTMMKGVMIDEALIYRAA